MCLEYPVARIDASCGPNEVWIRIWDKDKNDIYDKVIYQSEQCNSTREAIGVVKRFFNVEDITEKYKKEFFRANHHKYYYVKNIKSKNSQL